MEVNGQFHVLAVLTPGKLFKERQERKEIDPEVNL
jgi:hypothetical protein